MNVVTVRIDGRDVVTLKEMVRPGLRAVFVGINPTPASVSAGHYYQGNLGQRLWARIQAVGIVHDLPRAGEDDAAFAQGVGFVDLVRRPTSRSADIGDEELALGAASLPDRIAVASGAVLVFVFKRAFEVAAPRVMARGWQVARMPGPYERADSTEEKMKSIRRMIDE